MPVTTLRYEHNGSISWGVLRDGNITPIEGSFPTTRAFIEGVDVAALKNLHGDTVPESDVTILSPVTRDARFVCQGANYRQHMIESGMNPDDKNFNMIFTKAPSCICPADSDVVRPSHVRFLDYEVELGLIIKRTIDKPETVTDANLHEYVAGLVIVNDVSARDIQVPEMQFYKGKSYRTFGPCGPYLVLLEKEDMSRVHDLQLLLKVNGTPRQDDNTSELVFKPAETLAELSGVHDFSPGDLLATGTPSGCALSVPSPAKQKIAALLPEATKWKIFMKVQAGVDKYLNDGDVMEATIKSPDGVIDLGKQVNRIVPDDAAAL